MNNVIIPGLYTMADIDNTLTLYNIYQHNNNNMNINRLSTKAYYTVNKGYIKLIPWCFPNRDIVLKNLSSNSKFKKLEYKCSKGDLYEKCMVCTINRRAQ